VSRNITKPSFATKLSPLSRRGPVVSSTHCADSEKKEEDTVRKTLIALAATTGLLGLGTVGASALTLGPVNGDQVKTSEGSVIQKADWYCGPRCQYSHQRRWQEHRRWDEGRWRHQNYGYNRYGYNGPYGYYR
jgi:hypothetical protein